MWRRIVGILAVLIVFTLCASTEASAKTRAKTKKTRSHPRTHHALPVSAPSDEIYADIVIEAHTGRILHEVNGSSIRHPASLTKMMTLYLTFQAIENGVIRLETPLPVSAKAAGQDPTKLGLRAGQTVRVYDAIMGLVTVSANDAAVVLAEALGGSTERFAEMMVAQARALGMRHTVFQNPNGLPDPEQITSARDMATLGYALIYHYPGFYPYFSHNNFVYKGRSYNNHNNLMKRYVGMDGIKTGYIRASGFNLVASAVEGETRLIAAIFGGRSAASRDGQMTDLLDNGFQVVDRPAQQGDKFLPLPSKVAAVFGSRREGGVAARPQRPQPTAPQQAGLAEPPPVIIEDEGEANDQSAGAWGIQVGAFSDVAGAQQSLGSMARIMAPLLGRAEQSVQKVTMADGSPMYRARFMGLEQKTAREACSYMVKHGQSCLVVTGP